MQQNIVDKIKSDPKYHELVSQRSFLAWVLSILVCIIYFGFILLIAYFPSFLGAPLGEGSLTTVGIPIGVLVIVSSFLLTGIYVWRANSKFDQLTKEIKEGVK